MSGKTTAEQAAQIRERDRASRQAIDGRTDWTALQKQARLARVHRDTQRQLDELRASAAQDATREFARLAKSIHGPSGLSPSAADWAGWRDCVARAEQLAPEAASRALRLAERSGDRAMQRAIASRAVDRVGGLDGGSWLAVLNQYVEQHPSEEADYQAYVTGSVQPDPVSEALTWSIERPHALAGLSQMRIDDLANTDPESIPHDAQATR